MILGKYSMGIGDRFGRQGRAQLRAMAEAARLGIDVVPVWNKSFREHSIVNTKPADVRAEADAAVRALKWPGRYHVDADHIALKNVDLFIEASDFFTLDVADLIGKPAEEKDVAAFIRAHEKLTGRLNIPGVPGAIDITKEHVTWIARKYLLAVQEAGRIYRRIAEVKGSGNFIAEVSMDETDEPQTPVDMLFILAAIADEKIPAQTIAPKFSGRFNKGVDYEGPVEVFAREFESDVAVIAFAVKEFGLPGNMKLSVHSGSDKFSIYKAMNRTIRKSGAGLHLKTAGTTWLEECIGLAMAGGDGLEIAKDVYLQALGRMDELIKPYASVVKIDPRLLPTAGTVAKWSGEQYVAALRHDQSVPEFNPHFRQLIHVGYKVAAEMGRRYLDALEKFEAVIARNVAENVLERHIKPLFG